MKQYSPRRHSRTAARALFEALETRQLLTFQLVTPIDDFITSSASSTVPLDGHFEDPAAASTIVRLRIDALSTPSATGHIDLQLTDAATPVTVNNFLNYVNSGRYNNTIIHRSEPGWVIQSGGYLAQNGLASITRDAPIVNEFSSRAFNNIRGTIAMAKTSDPNSATSEWFINLSNNNSLSLDDTSNSGGFTTFGQVVGSGMTLVDGIVAVPRYNLGSPFNNLPLAGLANGAPAAVENLVTVTWATAHATYSASFTNPTLIASANVVGSQLVLTYAAGQIGTSDVTVTATSLANPADTATDTFTVTVAPPPAIAVTDAGSPVVDNTTIVDLGPVAQGTTPTRTIRITNAADPGDDNLSFGTPTIPAGFSIQSITLQGGATVSSLADLEIPPGQYADIVLALNPTHTPGTRNGTFVLPTDDPALPSFDLKLTATVQTRKVGVSHGATTLAHNQATPLNLGSTSAASYTFTLTVANSGSALPLVPGSVSLPDGYSVVTPLPSSIPAGGSASLVIAVDTTSVGTKSGPITINTDDPVTPAFTVPVTAEVSHGIISATLNGAPLPPNQLVPFGQAIQQITSSKIFVIKNTGNAPLTFTAPTVPAGFIWGGPFIGNTAGIAPIAPGAEVEVTIYMIVATPGMKAGTLVLNSSDPHTPAFQIPLSGEVQYRNIEVAYLGSTFGFDTTAKLATPAISLGGIAETTDTQLTFRVTNTGNLPLTLSSPTLPVGYTVVTPLPDSLAPSAFADLVVRVNTATIGAHNDILVINSNDPDYDFAPSDFRIPINYTVNHRRLAITSLTGTPATAGSTVDFGTHTQGETSQFSYRLTNTGDLPLSLDNLSVPTGFLVTNFPSTLAPGASADVTVSLNLLGQRGNYAGALSFTTNDPTRPSFSLNLTGRVLAKGIVVSLAGSAIPFGSASTVNFGKVRRGATAPTVTFTVANSGIFNLDIQATTIPTGYTVISGLPATLAPGASAQLTVALDSSTAGTFAGDLHIVSSDPDRQSFDVPLAAAVSLPVTLGKGGAQSVSYTDNDGTITTLSLTGPGSAVLDFFGSAPIAASTRQSTIVNPKGVTLGTITLSGTSLTKSRLTITTAGGNKSADLGDLTGTPLLALSASTSRLTGTINLNVRTIDLASADGGTLTLKAGTTLNLTGAAKNTTLAATGNLKSLKAASWTGGSIAAKSIDALDVTSNLAADLTVKKSVTGAIKGSASGVWNVGSINRLTLGSTTSAWDATATGAVTSLTITKNLAGSLAAKSIGTLAANSIKNATLTTTGAVGSVAVNGNIQNSTLRASRNINSLSANTLTGSRIYAGVDPSLSPPVTAAIFKKAAISSLTVRQFVNSSVAAKTLTKVTLAFLKTRNGATPHGLSASTISSLSAKLDTGKSLTLSNIKSGTTLTAALKAQKITLNDTRILIA